MRVLASNPPLRITKVVGPGDVVFFVEWRALGITYRDFEADPLLRTHFFADVVGELLVRRHFDVFKNLVITMSDYHVKVKAFNHQHFGMKMINREFRFQFHLSLLHQLMNEELAHLLTGHLAYADSDKGE